MKNTKKLGEMFSSEKGEDERGPMPTSAIKDLLKKWEDVRTAVSERNQIKVNMFGDLYDLSLIHI